MNATRGPATRGPTRVWMKVIAVLAAVLTACGGALLTTVSAAANGSSPTAECTGAAGWDGTYDKVEAGGLSPDPPVGDDSRA